MRTLATIFGALALMTWGVSAQEGSVPAPAADAQPALAAPAVTPAAEAQPAAELQPAASAAVASQAAPEASAEPKTAPPFHNGSHPVLCGCGGRNRPGHLEKP